MIDDDRLAALFRAAADDPDAPPPGFDHADVVAGSRRVTLRRRAGLIAASVAVFAVVGVGAVVLRPASDATMAAAPAVVPEAGDVAGQPGKAAPNGQVAAGEAAGVPPPGGASVGGSGEPRSAGAGVAGGPAVGGAAGSSGAGAQGGPEMVCSDQPDPVLRALLDQELPEVVGAEPTRDRVCDPPGGRHANLQVDDHGVPGVLGVTYLPPGYAVALPRGAVSAPAASGGTVIVHSSPAAGSGPAPFADRLTDIAARLAPRL